MTRPRIRLLVCSAPFLALVLRHSCHMPSTSAGSASYPNWTVGLSNHFVLRVNDPNTIPPNPS